MLIVDNAPRNLAQGIVYFGLPNDAKVLSSILDPLCCPTAIVVIVIVIIAAAGT